MKPGFEDYDMTEFGQSWVERDECDESHLTLRETPPFRVREQWAEIRLLSHQMELERELAAAHITEQLDHDLDHPVPVLVKPTSEFEDFLDMVGVLFCRFVHRAPNYRRGDQYSQCPTCKRKYALPWADLSKVDSDTYIDDTPFAPTEPTRQARCRNGLMGEV